MVVSLTELHEPAPPGSETFLPSPPAKGPQPKREKMREEESEDEQSDHEFAITPCGVVYQVSAEWNNIDRRLWRQEGPAAFDRYAPPPKYEEEEALPQGMTYSKEANEIDRE